MYKENSKKKVAAYCRVSTDSSDQIHSLSAQRAYFTEYISDNDKWEMADVYYDEGITGTSTKKREGFNRMIADCEKGKIDTILTKEVSRFARNTVDTLNFTRKLQELGINVIFMNDGIDTNDKDGELRLTLMASIAQEESRKTSERIKWSIKRNMENGFVLGCGRVYGFRVIGGKLEVVPEEAEIVKEVFRSYAYDGKGAAAIANDLRARNIPTLKNKTWGSQNILNMIANEKYVGDLTQRKNYKPNILSEHSIVNRGDDPDNPLITIKNHHEGIVSRELWDAVQKERQRRSAKNKSGSRHSKAHWFSGLCTCGKCGYSYISAKSSRLGFGAVACRNRQLYGKEKRTDVNGAALGCDNRTVDERVLAIAMKSVMENIYDISEQLKSELLSEIQCIQKSNITDDISSKQNEISKLKQKKLKAVDLMLEGLLDKDGLKEQTEFYDGEIAKLSDEISKHKSAETVYNDQIESLKEAIRKIELISDSDNNNTELYRSMIDNIIIPEYGRLEIFLKGLPFGFKIKYSIKKVPIDKVYAVIIDYCELDR
ncbi:recombinase family protein [Ruminococcus albus]|uniref:Site-specific DNA recombinase n=1 Tax=Ruminococcus albus TaxID=1264 RepID=A0A1I1MYV6_RUMAL|nr:recombinase family protein [Ruminococcus albus]SFC90559.1 Site-specific DNA recombinase [Ruminococcus albus]